MRLHIRAAQQRQQHIHTCCQYRMCMRLRQHSSASHVACYALQRLEQGPGSGGVQPSEPGGLTAAISRAVVGALSAALRARECSANVVDSISSCLNLGECLAGLQR